MTIWLVDVGEWMLLEWWAKWLLYEAATRFDK